MLLFLLSEFNGLLFVLSFFLLMFVLLLHNIGSFDTFLDISNSFFLRSGGLGFSILNLLGHLSDHGCRVSNSGGLLSLFLSLGLDNLLSGGDRVGNLGQLFLIGLDIGRLGGSGHLGSDFLFLCSELSDLFFLSGDGLVTSLNNFCRNGDKLFKLLSLLGSDFLNSHSFLSQLSGNLLLLNDLSRDISS